MLQRVIFLQRTSFLQPKSPQARKSYHNEPVENKASHSMNQQAKEEWVIPSNGNDEIQPVVIIFSAWRCRTNFRIQCAPTAPEPHPVETKPIPKGNLGLNSLLQWKPYKEEVLFQQLHD